MTSSRTRRRSLGGGALAVALLLAACEPVSDAPQPPPKLSFVETSYDFGRVPQGVPVEHRFAFANDGGTELSIISLRAACDCEATLEGDRDLAPHTVGVVRGRFDTDAVYGPQRRTITVYSNDPTQRAVSLTVSGEVLLDVVADPPRAYLGIVPPGVPLLREIALRAASDDVRLGAPQADAPQLAVRIGAATDRGATATLGIGTAPAAPLGPFSAVVSIPTTSPRHPMLRIAVAGIVAADAPTPRPRNTPTPEGGDGGAGAGGEE